MKTLATTLAVGLAVALSAVFASSALSPEEKEAVAVCIEKEATEKSAEEDRQARKTIMETSPETPGSFAVLYTLEGVRGGTDWLQYLVVFTRKQTGLSAIGPIRIGGKGLRSVEFKAYDKGVLALSTLNYSASDALCCPSVPGVTHVVVGAYGLEESDTRILATGVAKIH